MVLETAIETKEELSGQVAALGVAAGLAPRRLSTVPTPATDRQQEECQHRQQEQQQQEQQQPLPLRQQEEEEPLLREQEDQLWVQVRR